MAARAVKRFLFVECTLFNQGVRGITPAIPLPPSTSCARSAARGGYQLSGCLTDVALMAMIRPTVRSLASNVGTPRGRTDRTEVAGDEASTSLHGAAFERSRSAYWCRRLSAV